MLLVCLFCFVKSFNKIIHGMINHVASLSRTSRLLLHLLIQLFSSSLGTKAKVQASGNTNRIYIHWPVESVKFCDLLHVASFFCHYQGMKPPFYHYPCTLGITSAKTGVFLRCAVCPPKMDADIVLLLTNIYCNGFCL